MRLTTARDLPGGCLPVPRTTTRFVVVACLMACMMPGSPAFAAAAKGPVAREKKPTVSTPLDLEGKPLDPLGVTNAAATVLIIVGSECPISNRYAPELRRLHEKFKARGVRFWIVYPDPDITAAEIRKHMREYNLPGDAVRDPRHSLVGKSKAMVTPEAAVFTSAMRLAYHGRIDDRVVDFGKERPAPTQRDLHDAIELVLAGKKPRSPSAAAVGCRIPDLR